ncbi:MAG: hypothetical protein ACRCZU_08595 [Selenomonadaceae bacterium]|jgi:hypothetical protein
MKKIIACSLIFSAYFSFSLPADAAPHMHKPSNPAPISVQDISALSPEAQRLAKSLQDLLLIKDPSPEILELQQDDLTHGEIAIAYGLSDLSGQSLEQIMELRQNQHMGWGRIAKKFGVKVSDAVHLTNNIMHHAEITNEDDWTDHFFAENKPSSLPKKAQKTATAAHHQHPNKTAKNK